MLIIALKCIGSKRVRGSLMIQTPIAPQLKLSQFRKQKKAWKLKTQGSVKILF
jgi:hypothetical protein